MEPVEQLLKESRDISLKLNAYQKGVEALSLPSFERVLSRAEHLRNQLDNAIGRHSSVQNTLLQMREQLDHALSQGASESALDASPAADASNNPFALFSGSVRSDVQVNEFEQFDLPNINP